MNKTIINIFLLIIITFTLTGCSSKSGIDNYYFIVSIGIDKGNNNLNSFSIQVSSTESEDPSGNSGSSQASNSKIFTVEASTIDEAFTILNNFLDKKINLSHCSALVFSEEIAKEGILPYYNALSNNTELRNTCNLMISSSSAYELLNNVSNSGETFSSRLFEYLSSTNKYTGFTNESTIGTFFEKYNSNSNEPTAIYTIVGDDIIQTSGIAVFKDDKMVGHIDQIESISHLIITNELKKCTISIENPFQENTKADLDLNLYKKTKIDFQILNESPFISINIYPECTIRNVGNSYDLTESKNIEKLEIATNNYLEKIIKNYLYDITKNYNSDIASLESLYKSRFLTEEEFSKLHWKNIFRDSYYTINVNTRINFSNLYNKE